MNINCSAHVSLVKLKDFRKGAMSRRVGTVQCVACLTLLSLDYIVHYEGIEVGGWVRGLNKVRVANTYHS